MHDTNMFVYVCTLLELHGFNVIVLHIYMQLDACIVHICTWIKQNNSCILCMQFIIYNFLPFYTWLYINYIIYMYMHLVSLLTNCKWWLNNICWHFAIICYYNIYYKCWPDIKYQALSPLYSATILVSLIVDSEQLPGDPADAWLPPKHASKTEMRMDHYGSTWTYSEAGFQKHWHWRASSCDKNVLTWFHYCGIRHWSVCNIVRFPEESHLAVWESWTSLLASIHRCYSTRQRIPSLLQAHQSAYTLRSTGMQAFTAIKA